MFQFQRIERGPARERGRHLFNAVRMYQGQPVRLWSAPDRGLQPGRYVIFPDGRMVYVAHFVVAMMPPAPPAEASLAFPPQQQGERV